MEKDKCFKGQKRNEMIDRFKKLCELVNLPSPMYGSVLYEKNIEKWPVFVTDKYSASVLQHCGLLEMWKILLNIHK